MLDFVQQLVSGIALGCVYGLIALGFVLIYKATEVVNFAQGDLMMLGGFFAFTFIGMLGLNYWLGFAARRGGDGAVRHAGRARGDAADPRLSAIFDHHGHDRARLFPALRRRHDLGHRRSQDRDAVQPGVLRLGALVLAYDKLSVIVATVDPVRAALSLLQSHRLGTAMRATSENMLAAYYMGIPVKHVVSLIWAISAAVATCAGVLLAPITFIHSNVGLVLGLKAFPAAVLGGFGSIPGAVVGGVDHRRDREHGRLLPGRRAGRTSRPTSSCWWCCCSARGPVRPRPRKKV